MRSVKVRQPIRLGIVVEIARRSEAGTGQMRWRGVRRRMHVFTCRIVDGSILERRGGSMVSRGFPAREVAGRSGAGGGNRTLTSGKAQRIFVPSTAFAALTRASGLRSGLSLHRPSDGPGLRCRAGGFGTAKRLRTRLHFRAVLDQGWLRRLV